MRRRGGPDLNILWFSDVRFYIEIGVMSFSISSIFITCRLGLRQLEDGAARKGHRVIIVFLFRVFRVFRGYGFSGSRCFRPVLPVLCSDSSTTEQEEINPERTEMKKSNNGKLGMHGRRKDHPCTSLCLFRALCVKRYLRTDGPLRCQDLFSDESVWEGTAIWRPGGVSSLTRPSKRVLAPWCSRKCL